MMVGGHQIIRIFVGIHRNYNCGVLVLTGPLTAWSSLVSRNIRGSVGPKFHSPKAEPARMLGVRGSAMLGHLGCMLRRLGRVLGRLGCVMGFTITILAMDTAANEKGLLRQL